MAEAKLELGKLQCAGLPSHQDAGDLRGKGLSHLTAAHVGNAVQGQAHEGRIAARQVILDGVVDEANQLTVGVHQHRDEQVALEQGEKEMQASWKLRKRHRCTLQRECLYEIVCQGPHYYLPNCRMQHMPNCQLC